MHRKIFKEYSVSEDRILDFIKKSKEQKSPIKIRFAKGGFNRSTVLISPVGDVYTVDIQNGKNLSAGNLLKEPIDTVWNRLPLDHASHLRKYIPQNKTGESVYG